MCVGVAGLIVFHRQIATETDPLSRTRWRDSIGSRQFCANSGAIFVVQAGCAFSKRRLVRCVCFGIEEAMFDVAYATKAVKEINL